MNKVFVIFFLTVLFSCLSPDDISVSADSDAIALDQILKMSILNHEGVKLKKQVMLDESSETIEIDLDTLIIKKDLKVLMEYSFARLIRPANYNKTALAEGIFFERKKKEKKGPVSVLIHKNNEDQVNSLEIKFEEENYLYRSHQFIQLEFDNERLVAYKIAGNRKLIGLDSSNYQIQASITNN